MAQLLILAEVSKPETVLGVSLILMLLGSRAARFPLVLLAVGISGWWLPANQHALDAFQPPSSALQGFEVISTSQSWGKQQRYWIQLPESGGRIGYLITERGIALDFGASYRAQLSVEVMPGLERAGYAARLRGDYEQLSAADGWDRFIGESRSSFQRRVSGVSANSVGLVLGLTVGDRSQISDELTVAMRELSLSHIVAVSGANLAIAMGAAFFLARSLGAGRRVRFLAASGTALGYAAVVGPEPSVLRALFMAHVVLLCLALGRGAAAPVAISWAALILLAADPFLATDFGFALSVSATAGILLLAQPLQRKLEPRVPRLLALGLAVSVSAQLFTMPILLMLQPGIPTYAVFANLLVMPLLTPITLLGLLAFALQPLPLVTELLSNLASLPAWIIEQVSAVLIKLPMTRLPWPDLHLGVALAATIAALVAFSLLVPKDRLRSRFAKTAILLACFGSGYAFSETVKSAFPGDWLAIACDVGQGDALLIKSDQAVALIDVGPDLGAISECLKRANVRSIDLLVLTHFDIDHVGALQAVLDCCDVRAAMLPDFQDDREVVNVVNQQLAAEPALRRLTAASGLAGRLGQLDWTVLSPGVIEKATADSNAASIVLLIESEQYRLLALADVPAAVQDRLSHRYAASLAAAGEKTVIVKVAHHGAADQSAEFMESIDPDYAIFSSGRDNRYGHPTQQALGIARAAGATIFRTDLRGSAVLRSENGLLRFD